MIIIGCWHSTFKRMHYTFGLFQVGYIMFYVRSPAEGGQTSIYEALSVLVQVVPSVQGIFFKDLKQTLRKEQCDVSENSAYVLLLICLKLTTSYW